MTAMDDTCIVPEDDKNQDDTHIKTGKDVSAQTRVGKGNFIQVHARMADYQRVTGKIARSSSLKNKHTPYKDDVDDPV